MCQPTDVHHQLSEHRDPRGAQIAHGSMDPGAHGSCYAAPIGSSRSLDKSGRAGPEPPCFTFAKAMVAPGVVETC